MSNYVPIGPTVAIHGHFSIVKDGGAIFDF